MELATKHPCTDEAGLAEWPLETVTGVIWSSRTTQRPFGMPLPGAGSHSTTKLSETMELQLVGAPCLEPPHRPGHLPSTYGQAEAMQPYYYRTTLCC